VFESGLPLGLGDGFEGGDHALLAIELVTMFSDFVEEPESFLGQFLVFLLQVDHDGGLDRLEVGVRDLCGFLAHVLEVLVEGVTDVSAAILG